MRMQLTGALIVAAISIAYGVATADDAKALYDKKCKACHSLKGDAGKFADKGGPLDGVPLFLQNEADVAALGEMEFNPTPASDPLLYVSINQGLGAGVIALWVVLDLENFNEFVVDTDESERYD